MKRLMVAGCIAWVVGLVVTIVGLNIPAPTGSWLSVAGNIVFFAGLFCVGTSWLVQRRAAEKKEDSDS